MHAGKGPEGLGFHLIHLAPKVPNKYLYIVESRVSMVGISTSA